MLRTPPLHRLERHGAHSWRCKLQPQHMRAATSLHWASDCIHKYHWLPAAPRRSTRHAASPHKGPIPSHGGHHITPVLAHVASPPPTTRAWRSLRPGKPPAHQVSHPPAAAAAASNPTPSSNPPSCLQPLAGKQRDRLLLLHRFTPAGCPRPLRWTAPQSSQ